MQILTVDTRQTQLSKPLRMYLSRSLQTYYGWPLRFWNQTYFLGRVEFRLIKCFPETSNFSSKILIKVGLKISTLIQTQNHDKNSASKSWPKLSFKVLTKICFNFNFTFSILTNIQVQNLYQASASKFSTKLLSTRTFQSINISNTNNIKKFWVGIFKSQGHFSRVY